MSVRFSIAVACLLFVGCAGDVDGDARDGGGGKIIILPGDRDGGPAVPRDGGPNVDAGFTDGGVPRDGGFDPNRDAGPPRDGGPPRDAGPVRDAGPRDGGVQPPRDGGPQNMRDGGVQALFNGQVYLGTALGGSPIETRQDAFIDFNWGAGSPQPGVPVDNFSIRWTATVQADYSETYTFITESDDGVRLFVNGNAVIDNWTDHGVTRDTGTMMLTAGQTYDIRLEYYDSGFDAVIRLLWSSPSQAETAIPAIGSSSFDGGVGGPRDGGMVGGGNSSTRHTARPLGTTGAGNGFYEYLPPNYNASGAPYPLMVFWHGVGENGNGSTDLFRVLVNGPPRLIDDDQWPNSRPWVVLSPQHPGGGCPGVSEIQSFIAWAVSNYNVDPNRVHLTGLSCGAIGSWNYLGVHLDSQVAGAVLIAGDGRNAFSNAGCALGAVAIWGFHGTGDTVVSPQGTIQAMNNLIACPVRDDAILTTYPGVPHDSWTQTYDLSAGHDIYGWLLQQVR
ncbi:MAG: PA14 domain-containing protein [Deltaproteobacteria bacterium]|jgi:predicted esterase